MLEQKMESDFILETPDLAVSPRGIEVEFEGRRTLKYRRNGKSISFYASHDYISNVFFSTIVFLNNATYWDSGEEMTEDELLILKEDIRDGLVAFESLTFFEGEEKLARLMADVKKAKSSEGVKYEQ